MLEILDRHPHHLGKIGPGVEEFFVARTRDADGVFVDANVIGIWVRRTDGSKIDCSYHTAIHQPSTRSDAKKALRAEVDDRRKAYREHRFGVGETVLSDLFGVPFDDFRDAQVVYLTPTWGQLTFRFAELEGGRKRLAVAPAIAAVAAVGSRLENRDQATRWLAFHAQCADLGLASASEAARRAPANELGWAISSDN